MAKRILSLYVDAEVISLAKQKIGNISLFVNEMMKTEVGLSDRPQNEQLDQLKLLNAKLSSELDLTKRELQKANNSNVSTRRRIIPV